MSPALLEPPAVVSDCPSTERLAKEREGVLRRVELALELLRQARSETGWTYEQLEAFTGKSQSYLHAVLQGEKPCSLQFMMALPDEVRSRLVELAAGAVRPKLICIRPAAPEEALAVTMSGLLGLM